MKLIVFEVVWRICPRMKHTTAQFISIICCQFLSNQTKWHEHPRRASLLIHFLTSIMLLRSTSHTVFFEHDMIHAFMSKLKQLDEHMLCILFCPSARKHKYCILLMWYIYYCFWMCFILQNVQFLRQYSPLPVPLTLSFAYVSTSRKVMWYGWILIAHFYYCCFLLQIQVHESIRW